MNDQNEYLNYSEAARLLRISPMTLRKKVHLKQVPVWKPFGPKGRVLFKAEDLRAFVEARRVDPVNAGPSRASQKVAAAGAA